MNSVSWFIYIAQVSNSMGMMFIALGSIGVAACGIHAFARTMCASMEDETFKPIFPQARYVALTILLLVIGNMMPAQNTMYAIAASQVGEKIINSEAVRGVADDASLALQQWIRRQIEPKEQKKSK